MTGGGAGPVVATACGKAILLGEHAVVYGEPALAVPMTGLVTRVSASVGDEDTVVHERGNDTRMAERMLRAAREQLGLETHGPRLEMRIDGDLPVGVGMGSSAALAVALVRVLLQSSDRDPGDATFLGAAALELERLAHGNPSGIDPAVVAAGKPIYFKKGAEPRVLALPDPFPVLVADTGVASDTGAVVAGVRERRDADPDRIDAVIRRIGEIVEEAARLLAASPTDLAALGRLMNENQEHLRTLGVSADANETLVAAASEAGALGAKLSGAGMGGIVVVLVRAGEEERVASALREAGARWVGRG